MSTFGDSQVRNLFVAIGDILVPALNVDGAVDVVAEGDNIVVKMSKGGEVYNSAPINKANILSEGDKVMVTSKTAAVVTLSGVPVVGEALEIVLYLDEYGAHNTTDATSIRGWHKIQTGDTLASITTAITASLKMTAEKSGFGDSGDFGISISSDDAAVITIEYKRGTFNLGKFDGKVLTGRVLVKTFESGLASAVTYGATPINNGIEVANLEWFAEGNRGDVYRGTGYPNNYDGLYIVNPALDYEFYELAFYSERISAPGDKQRQMVTVAGSTALIAAFKLAIDAL